MSDWDEFNKQLLEALRRFVQGDAEPVKSLWSHADDVMIFGGWGAWEQGWAAVEPRLDWAASRYAEGWLDRENLLDGVDQDIAYSVDIERSGGRFDNAPEVREAPLRVTHLFRREDGQWRIVHRHADFLQPRQEPR
jgi:ketosteroid isomerase-like protein